MEISNLPPPGSPDIDIARAAKPRKILELAKEKLGIDQDSLIPFGHDKAKISHEFINQLQNNKKGKLVLVTAVTPTPAGEGKTTTSVGLNDGLNSLGVKSMVCLREPSLGPCFGMKGGAAGGGRSQVIPMEDINLHFTGDFHAITSANNLLSAMLDNHIYWGNELEFDTRRVMWRRVMDMNDRALRNMTIGLGGATNGVPREDGFFITVASEVMAIFCLAENLKDLERRIGNMVIGLRRDKTPITARDLGADKPMVVLLKDAFQPNLVQSIEHAPAIIHGGPFANIAHGCNSVIATKTALSIADVVVTEAGFGADLGAEKFIDIKCRQSGLRPDALVLVCTIRALKMQGGVAKADLGTSNVAALQKGSSNLIRHISNMRKFGLNPIVAINHYLYDSEEEVTELLKICEQQDVVACMAKHWAEGGKGAEELAKAVINALEQPKPEINFMYDDDEPLEDKIRSVVSKIYGASDIALSSQASSSLKQYTKLGYGNLPICIAKTQYSFTNDPKKMGAPEGHILEVRDVRLSAGAGFIVAVCGDIMTMPGLPRHPAALDIALDEDGLVVGLS